MEVEADAVDQGFANCEENTGGRAGIAVLHLGAGVPDPL